MGVMEFDYLKPQPLTSTQIESIYGRDPKEDDREEAFGRAAFETVR